MIMFEQSAGNAGIDNPASFDQAKEAHQAVQSVVKKLRKEYDDTVTEIDVVEAKLARLPEMVLPFEDLKAAILDFVTGSGEKHGASTIRAGICKFATGQHVDNVILTRRGMPLTYGNWEGAMNEDGREYGPYKITHLLTNGRAAAYDQVLFAVAETLVRDAFTRIMADITPAELGYDKISNSEIGSPRAERRQEIEALQRRLASLIEKRRELGGQLADLGHVVPFISADNRR
jgi:hypothetical protein